MYQLVPVYVSLQLKWAEALKNQLTKQHEEDYKSFLLKNILEEKPPV